jgi:hypothetical protein
LVTPDLRLRAPVPDPTEQASHASRARDGLRLHEISKIIRDIEPFVAQGKDRGIADLVHRGTLTEFET